MALGLSRDIKLALLGGVIVILVVIGLAFYLDYRLIAAQGVGFVGTILGLPESVLNGISSAITGFFGWLSHFFSNLFVLPLYSYVV